MANENGIIFDSAILQDGLQQTDIDSFDTNLDMRSADPRLMWSAIRPWAALNISCWDFLCDKAKWAEYSSCSEEINSLESQTYKLQVTTVHIKSMGIPACLIPFLVIFCGFHCCR